MSIFLSIISPVKDKYTIKNVLPTWVCQQVSAPFEVLVVDYGSKHQDVVSDVRGAITSHNKADAVYVLKTGGSDVFSRGKALNIAIRKSRGKFIFPCDADIVLPVGYVEQIRKRADTSKYLRCPGVEGASGKVRTSYYSWGMTVYPSTTLVSMRGYDERMAGWGVEDEDLGMRVRMLGLKEGSMALSWTHLTHKSKDRIQHQPWSRNTSHRRNNKLRQYNKQHRRIVANTENDRWGLPGDVEVIKVG